MSTLAPAFTSAAREGVGVSRAAVAEHDGFHQRRPAQIVDMVERRAGGDQHAHDLRMTEMGGGDKRGAVIDRGDGARVAAAVERDLEAGQIVCDRRDGDDVVAPEFKPVRIRAETEQGTRGLVLLHEDGHMQRRSLLRIGGVERGTVADGALDRGNVALGCSGVKAAIRGDGVGRRCDLRGCRDTDRHSYYDGWEQAHDILRQDRRLAEFIELHECQRTVRRMKSPASRFSLASA
jgi:hypothetical protein